MKNTILILFSACFPLLLFAGQDEMKSEFQKLMSSDAFRLYLSATMKEKTRSLVNGNCDSLHYAKGCEYRYSGKELPEDFKSMRLNADSIIALVKTPKEKDLIKAFCSEKKDFTVEEFRGYREYFSAPVMKKYIAFAFDPNIQREKLYRLDHKIQELPYYLDEPVEPEGDFTVEQIIELSRILGFINYDEQMRKIGNCIDSAIFSAVCDQVFRVFKVK